MMVSLPVKGWKVFCDLRGRMLLQRESSFGCYLLYTYICPMKQGKKLVLLLTMHCNPFSALLPTP